MTPTGRQHEPRASHTVGLAPTWTHRADALGGRWSFQVVQEFDDLCYLPSVAMFARWSAIISTGNNRSTSHE